MSSDRPKIGIGLARMHPQDMLTLAREADEAGIHAITVGDSSYDSLAVLSATSVVTRRIKLVTNVATWTRTPVTLVPAAAWIISAMGGSFWVWAVCQPVGTRNTMESPVRRCFPECGNTLS